jgi:hypothetical protein
MQEVLASNLCLGIEYSHWSLQGYQQFLRDMPGIPDLNTTTFILPYVFKFIINKWPHIRLCMSYKPEYKATPYFSSEKNRKTSLTRLNMPFSPEGYSSLFLVSWGGVRLSSLGTSPTVWPIVPAPDDRWWCVRNSRWHANWQGKQKYSSKSCLSAT